MFERLILCFIETWKCLRLLTLFKGREHKLTNLEFKPSDGSKARDFLFLRSIFFSVLIDLKRTREVL